MVSGEPLQFGQRGEVIRAMERQRRVGRLFQI